MTDSPQTPDRDDVLFAFHEACLRPTTKQIIDWTSRYPQFADDIRAHAAAARDLEAQKEVPLDEPTETTLARAYSRALNALYQADVKAPVHASNGEYFQDILATRGMDVPALAREVGGDIGIRRSVIADLINGRMRPPVGRRFLDASCRGLAITRDRFFAALERAIATPRYGLAKADTAPTVTARNYEDVVKDSGMTEDQIRYWLDD
nr:hypothetical protein [uncultured Rhodopila sp.]